MQKKWWTLLAVCLGTFMLLLDVTIVNVALPDIQHALHSSFSDLQWVVDAYALSLAALLLTGGSLSDLFGRRRLFAIGLVIFTAGSLMCGLAQSSEWLIVSRGGQGIGGAIMFATSLALLAQAFQGRERGLAFGVWGSITGIAVAVGPVLGGVLTTTLSWKWIFFVNVPVGVLAFLITVTRLEESRQPGAKRPDWAGFVLFTAGLSALVYGLIRTNEKSWSDPVVIGCFAAAGALLVVFVIVEAVSRHAMFELALFKKPTFVGGDLAAFALSASAFSLLLYLVLYLQDAKGYSALGTGLRLLVYSGAIMVAATISGRLSSHVPVKWLIAPGLILVGAGLMLMTALDTSSDWTVLIPGFVVAGIGTGMVNPPLASAAVGVVAPPQAGMASGINSTFRQVGIATGVAALGSIFGSQLTSRLSAELAKTPALAAHTSQLAAAIRGGAGAKAIAAVPPRYRQEVASASLTAFVDGLDKILLIGAIVAFAAGVLCLFLVRGKDFVVTGPAAAPTGDQGRPSLAVADDAPPAPSTPAPAGEPRRTLQAAGVAAGGARASAGHDPGAPSAGGEWAAGGGDGLDAHSANGARDTNGARSAGGAVSAGPAGNGNGNGSHSGAPDQTRAGLEPTVAPAGAEHPPAGAVIPGGPPAPPTTGSVPAEVVAAPQPVPPVAGEDEGGGEEDGGVTREISITLSFKLHGRRRR